MSDGLLVDLGNSRLKWQWSSVLGQSPNDLVPAPAAFHDRRWDELWDRCWEGLDRPDWLMVSNVAGSQAADSLLRWCQTTWRLEPAFCRVPKQADGLTNGYRDVSQMGVDRWLAMLAAWKECHSPLVVFDLGTALTVDVVNGDGLHQGGWIIPGPDLMRDALGGGTAEVRPRARDNFDVLGCDTAGCVEAGLVAALSGVMSLAEDVLEDEQATLFVTGGGWTGFERVIPEAARIRPNLVLRGVLQCKEGSHSP